MNRAFNPKPADISWAQNFKTLDELFEACDHSEKAALLLSTCRNAYLTVNALFLELSALLGNAAETSALRGACELMIEEADGSKVHGRLLRAFHLIHEFELKRDVWDDRERLWLEVQAAKESLKTLDPFAADRVDLMLKSVSVPETALVGGWYQEVMRLDLNERPHLDDDFLEIFETFDILRRSAHILRIVSDEINRSAQARFSLETVEKNPKDNDEREAFAELIVALATSCKWAVSRDDRAISIRVVGAVNLPGSGNAEISFPLLVTPDTAESIQQKLGYLLREALYFSHAKLRTRFRANVATPPMPAPFVVSLKRPEPDFDMTHTGTPIVRSIHCHTTEQKDTVRIAIANLAVPLSKLVLKGLHFAPVEAEQIRQDVRLLVGSAKAHGCDAIVFPEYSIPSGMAPELLELANENGLVIIGGLDGKWKDHQLCDEAAVAIPGEPKIFRQRKQEPSLEEETGEAFYRDGDLFLFSHTPIGDFSVIMCSDWLQLSNLQAWHSRAPLPELFFVIARNDHTEIYVNFAKADSVRFYAAIVIANVAEGKNLPVSSNGSCIVLPKHESQMLPGQDQQVAGTYSKGLTIFNVPIHAIRARSRGRAEKGFIAVPNSARRT